MAAERVPVLQLSRCWEDVGTCFISEVLKGVVLSLVGRKYTCFTFVLLQLVLLAQAEQHAVLHGTASSRVCT